jgi:hypothetical protein
MPVSDAIGLIGDECFRDLRDDHPAVEAYDAMLAEVRRELVPQVEGLFLEAIRKRLPFEWPTDDR